MNLFPDDEPAAFTPPPGPGPDAPLAERQRPRRLADYAGQQHLVGETGVLRRYLNAGRLPSLISRILVTLLLSRGRHTSSSI